MEAADSDHSLTWEDFYGSTTDLTPTLISILESKFADGDKKVKKDDVKRKMVPPTTVSPSKDPRLIAGGVKLPGLTMETPVEQVKKSPPSKPSYVSRLKSFGLKRSNACESKEELNSDIEETKGKIGAEVLPKMEPNKKLCPEKNSFDNLSPNVKRMLSSVAADDSKPLTLTQQKKSNLAGIRSSYRTKQSNIPLMGATSKITQTGVEIVSTADIYDKPSTLTRISVRSSTPVRAKDWSPKAMLSFSPEKKGEAPTVYDVPTNPAIYDVPKANIKVETNSVVSSEVVSPSEKPVDLKVNEEVHRLKVPAMVTRPLSTSSIASSSSTSSSGVQNKGGANSAYLASIESLDDHSDAEYVAKNLRTVVPSTGSPLANDSAAKSNDANPQMIIRPSTPPRPRYCDPSLSLLERVCTEIVDTENVYVEDLRQVVEGYLYTWRGKGTFAPEQLDDLFSNIEEIYNFNKKFSQNLNECNLEAVAIAKCFVNHSTGFGIYTEYCTGYPGTMAALARLVGAPESAQPFRAQQAELGHALPLGSYLLKPVQRILKYHLLLQNLVKQCKSHETEYALHKMTGIAHHINDMKRRHEHAVRVQEIQSLLYGWSGQDLTTYGELCAEGTFRVFGAKALRHAFLFDKMLLLTKNKEYGMLAYKSHILCNNLMLVESIQGQPLSFHVIPFDCPRMQVTLQARSIQHKREWTLLLKRVILENYSAVIPSHARQLVMELGQNKTDDDILAEKSNALISHSSMRKQMSAPEYLEKRKMDRDRRKSFESGLRYRLKRSATRKEPSYDSVVENEEKEQIIDSACEELCSCNDESSNVHLCPTCKNTYICNDCHNDTVTSSSFNCDDSRSSTEHFYDNSSNVCLSCHKNVDVRENVSSYSCENLKINQFSDKISMCHKCNSPMSFDKNVKENRKNIYDRLITIGPNIPEMNDLRKTCLRCLEIRENITAENRNVSREPTKSVSKDDLQTLHVPKMSSQRRKSEPGISSINMNEIQPIIGKQDVSLKTNVTCKNCGKSLPKTQKTLCGKHSQNDAQSPKNRKVDAPKNVNIEVKMYNAKTVPKKISKIKKNRAKTLRHRALDPTAKFYTDFTNDVGDSVLHISESTDSINTLNSQPNDTETSENVVEPKHVTKIPDGIDEETYKSLIQKTDSFKKSELEKDKLVSQNKQSSNVDVAEEEHPKDKTSNNTDSAGDVEEDAFESGDDAQNEKPLEVIISQLLMQNREFQKILKRHQLRNASNRRHQRLLKSYSNPEKTMQQMKDGQSKVKPKYGRQNSAIETIQHVTDKKLSEMNEEHIYETLMITSQKLIDESSSITNISKNSTSTPKKAETENASTDNAELKNKSDDNSPHTKTEDKPRLSLTESDYVYLCFDGKKNVLAYELPNDITKSINCEDLGVYAVPSALPKRASMDIVERRMVRDEIPVDNRASHDYLYENASEIWKRVSNDTVIENKPENNCADYSDSENVPQSPNLPEIWLDRQKEHFNTPRDKKSGSLPRSFHLVLDDDQQSGQSNKFHKKPGAFNKVYLNKEGKVLHSDRPFTIASDRSEISYEDIERFIKTNENSVLKFPNDSVSSNRSSTSFLDENADDVVDNVSRSTLELEAELEQCYKNKFGSGQEMKSILNNSLSSLQMKLINRSISSSLEVMNDKKEIEISHEDINVQPVHPEHRIYKPTSNILSLKSVLNKFKSKMRSSHENINTDDLSADQKPKKSTPPKNHSRNLLQRLISVKNDEQISETITENVDESDDLKDKKLEDTPVKVTIEHVDSNKNDLIPSKSFCEEVTSDLIVSVDEVSRSCNNISLSPKTPDTKANMSQSAQFGQIYNSAIVNKVARSTQDLNKLPTYRQGSQLLGARIAQSDYADPKLLKMNSNSNISSANVLINKHALRPDSLLSNSSHFTSSSEGCITSNSTVVKNNSFLYRNNSTDSSPNIESDKQIEKTLFKLNSDESFYEKSFEEIEHILDDEIFRDSAIFSDPDDNNFYSTDDMKPTKNESPIKMKPKILYKKFNNVSINEKKLIMNKSSENKSVVNGSLKIQNQKSDDKQTIEISLDTVGKKMEMEKKCLTNTKENEETKTKKVESEHKVSRLAPPVPIKPIFSKTTTQIMKCSINGKSFSEMRKSQEISIPEPVVKPSELKLPENTFDESESQKPEVPSPVKLPKPGIPKPSFQRSTSSNINMKRMSFERCSLDSSSISRRSKSVSVYKMDSNDNPVEEITITKSVQERRKEIEMMAENSTKKGDDSPPAFSRSISFKMNSGTTVAKPACTKRIPTMQKSNIPTCNGNVDKENNLSEVVDGSHSPISDKNDNAKGGWVKHVVNRFQ